MNAVTMIRLYCLHRRAPMSRRAAIGLVLDRIQRDAQFSVKKIKKSS